MGDFYKKVCYAFPGQGSQFVGMGKNIYKYKPAKKIFNIGNEILGFDITDLMFNGPEEKLKETINCQLAIFLTNLAYFSILKLNKEIPCLLTLGHSIGEYSALVASKALSLENAIKLVRTRAELMRDCIPPEKAEEGTSHMAAVLTDNLNPIYLINKDGKKCSAIELINEACEESSLYTGVNKGIVQIAIINSSSQIVISGDNNAVIRAVKHLKEKKIKKVVYLNVEGPFHSELMKPAAEGMKKALENMINEPKISFIANSTGNLMFEPNKIKESLVEQMYKTVRWKESLETAIQSGFEIFIESGSGEKQYKLLKRNYENITVLDVKDYIINIPLNLNIQKVNINTC